MQKIKKLNRNNPYTYKMHMKQKKPCQKQEKKYIEEMKKIAESRIAEIAYLVKLVAHEKARKDRRRSSRRDKAEKKA